MLVQLHHQFKDGHTEMVAQNKDLSEKKYRQWYKEITAKYVLPKDAQWLVCNEKSKHFVLATSRGYPLNTDGKGYNITAIFE